MDEWRLLGSLQDELGGVGMEVEYVSVDEGRTGGCPAHHAQQEYWAEQEQGGSGPPAGKLTESSEEGFPPPPSGTEAFQLHGTVESSCILATMGNMNALEDEEQLPVLAVMEPGFKPDSGHGSKHALQAGQPTDMSRDQNSASSEDPDATALLLEDGEERRVDCESWVWLESNSKPLSPAFSWSSSPSLTAELNLHDSASTHPNTHDAQQGESNAHSLSSDSENQEVQQVCISAPPLETVASETANPEHGCPTCGSIVVNEPLIEAAGCSEGERESEQTDIGRNQTVSSSGSVEIGHIVRETEYLWIKEEKEEVGLNSSAAKRAENTSRMDVDNFNDSQSDSGVSADFSLNSTVELSCASTARSSPEPSLPPPDETPIEREIRLALRREQSLRRSRGLDATQDKAKEFVEIPLRKSILSQDLPLKSVKAEGKERYFAGKKMQREIRLEAEREKVLVKLGRLPGFYDKGTVRQLREKKLLFEAFQEPKEILTAQSKSSVSVSDQETSAGCEASEISGSCTEYRQSLELLFQNRAQTLACRDSGFNANPSGARGPSLTEAVRGQVIILENSPSPAAPTPHQVDKPLQGVTMVDSGHGKPSFEDPCHEGQVQNRGASDDGGGNDNKEPAVLKENPFFKLRSSLSMRPDVQQDIQVAREREMELRTQRSNLYGRGAEVEDTSPPPSDSNTDQPQQTSKTFPTANSARQSLHGKLELTWPPPLPQQEHKEQPETQKSLKPPRQRSSLLERWESGLVNGHRSAQD